MSMNPEIKQRWVAALRSGEYPQGREALRSADGQFCCLGVLCELAVAEKITPPPVQGPIRGSWSYNGDSGYPSPAVYEWSGLDYDQATELANSNDSGDSFETIANVIEATL